jgi:hypothetical protein
MGKIRPVEFRFRIDVFTPATLPMKRLAEYMGELARLMGEEEHVHFTEVREGSLTLAHTVDPEAVPKVRDRLLQARNPDAPKDIRQPWRNIDEMLAKDNAVGTLAQRGRGGVVIKFPGRTVQRIEIGPVAEEGSIEGVLVRIGGQDRTAHAQLQDGDQVFGCEMSRDLAARLSPYLYGAPVRVYGRGRWRRSPGGDWTLIDFQARDFTVLDGASVADVADRLRALPRKGWEDSPDPLAELRRLRHGT